MERHRAFTWKRRSAVLVVALAAAATAVSACSSGGGPSASVAANSRPQATGASSCMSEATKGLKAAEAKASLVVDAKFDISKLKGTTVAFIGQDFNNPFNSQAYGGFQAAAKAAGLKVISYDGQGTVSGYTSAFDHAIAAGAAGIVYTGIEPQLVSGSLATAKSKNIATVAVSSGYGTGAYSVNYNLDDQGIADADNALVETDCKLNTLVVSANGFPTLVEVVKAYTDEVSRLCPSCSSTAVNVPAATSATNAGPTVTNALRRDPALNNILSSYDSQSAYIVAAVQSLGRDVPMESAFALGANISSYVAKQTVLRADVSGPPYVVIGWTDLDQLARALLKLPPSQADAKIQVQLIDGSNVSSAMSLPGFANYVAQYSTAWGLGS